MGNHKTQKESGKKGQKKGTKKEGNRQNPSLICKVARPIRFDSHDNNSTRLKAIQAQAREKLGLNVCGWKLDYARAEQPA